LVETALVAFFAVSGLALAGLALYLRASQLPNRGIRSFVSLLGLMAVWSFSAVGKLTLPPLVERFLVALELPMGVAFAFLFLVFASQYTGRRWHRQRAFTAYAVVSLLALAIGLLTNPVHGLFWEGITLSTAVFPHYVHSGLGPLYFCYVGLAYCHFATGVYALVNLHLRSRYNTTPMMLVTFGASLPLLVNLVSVFDRAPIPGLDYTPVGLAIFGLATTVSMQLDLFDIIPVARDTAVEQSSEGMVILDSKRRIRDYNPTAASLFPALSSSRGDHIDAVVDDAADLFDTTTSTTISVADGEELTYLSVQLSPITDGPHHLGWTVVLSDVTEQQRRERHLQLVSRVLRHNMANRINIIMGHVELLGERADETDRTHLDAIDASATSIIETSGKLRTIQDIVTGGRPVRPTSPGQSRPSRTSTPTATPTRRWRPTVPTASSLTVRRGFRRRFRTSSRTLSSTTPTPRRRSRSRSPSANGWSTSPSPTTAPVSRRRNGASSRTVRPRCNTARASGSGWSTASSSRRATS